MSFLGGSEKCIGCKDTFVNGKDCMSVIKTGLCCYCLREKSLPKGKKPEKKLVVILDNKEDDDCVYIFINGRAKLIKKPIRIQKIYG